MRQAFAGEGLGLSPDLVNYIGREAQQGRTDPRILTPEDQQIAEAITGTLVDTVGGGPQEGDYSNMPVIPWEKGEEDLYEQQMEGYRNRAFPRQWDDDDAPEILAGGPSFDLSYPKIPGRDVEGIPNANDPVMREKLRQRLLKNPGYGQDLPGFLRKA